MGKLEKDIGRLLLTLKPGEWIAIGANVRIQFNKHKGNYAISLCIEAPKDIYVDRALTGLRINDEKLS